MGKKSAWGAFLVPAACNHLHDASQVLPELPQPRNPDKPEALNPKLPRLSLSSMQDQVGLQAFFRGHHREAVENEPCAALA